MLAEPAALPVRRARLTPLPPQFPGGWAVAFGEDTYGLWQAFEVAGVRQVMRWIPPGSFTMGLPRSKYGFGDEDIEHRVDLTVGFWLADTACTQALWMAVMSGSNPSKFIDNRLNPVEHVNWSDVTKAFLPRLNGQVSGLAATLPTEAWWEYACRGDAVQNTSFWFGDEIRKEQVNFFDGGWQSKGKKSGRRQSTLPVKALPCNGWGLYQMHGNVWEWCADWSVPYPPGTAVDPTGPLEAPTESVARALRGGSCVDQAHDCGSGMRGTSVPGYRRYVGFRLARAAS